MGKILRRIVRLTILLLMYAPARLMRDDGIPVLAYHSVDCDATGAYSLSIDKFRRQIAYLKHNGYQSISLDNLISHVQGADRKAASKEILLTFDDGYKNFYTHVVPILRRFGFSSVLCVVTRFCDQGVTDYHQNESPLPALSWEDVLHVSDEAVEIASHSVRHVKLNSLAPEDALWEIETSKKRIERALNGEVKLFCYPHGVYTKETGGLVKNCGYKAALTTEAGLARSGDDVYQLKRVPIEPGLSLVEFKALLTPAAGWYFSLKNRILSEKGESDGGREVAEGIAGCC